MNNDLHSRYTDVCFKSLCDLAYNGDIAVSDPAQANASLRLRLQSALFRLSLLDNDEYGEVLSEHLWANQFRPLMEHAKNLTNTPDEHLPQVAEKLISFAEAFNTQRGAKHPETARLEITQ
jgi:hypothetical protein